MTDTLIYGTNSLKYQVDMESKQVQTDLIDHLDNVTSIEQNVLEMRKHGKSMEIGHEWWLRLR